MLPQTIPAKLYNKLDEIKQAIKENQIFIGPNGPEQTRNLKLIYLEAMQGYKPPQGVQQKVLSITIHHETGFAVTLNIGQKFAASAYFYFYWKEYANADATGTETILGLPELVLDSDSLISYLAAGNSNAIIVVDEQVKNSTYALNRNTS